MSITILLGADGKDAEAVEESTIAITIDFEDEDGDAVVPTEAKWTLTNDDGDVVDTRERVNISSLASSVDVVLKGSNLQILSGESGDRFATRRFLIEAKYNSSLGTGLPLNESCTFPVRNLKYVS